MLNTFAMETYYRNTLKKLLLMTIEFIRRYNDFLDTRDLNSNKRCNDAFMCLCEAVDDIGFVP